MANRTNDILMSGLTKGQLLAEIDHMPDDTPIVFVCDYGDYCNTQQALPVGEVNVNDFTSNDLAESPYSKSGIKLVEQNDDDGYDDDDEPNKEKGTDIIIIQM